MEQPNLNQPPEGFEYWGTHPQFPVAEWQYDVANGDTRCGYWEWVNRGLNNEEVA